MSTILVTEARARFNHAQSKLYLKEKYTNMMTVAHAGGMFKIDQSFISFLNNTECDVLIDMYDNPVRVNRLQLLELSTTIYNKVMNDWLEEYTALSKSR
jgi:hypothetical protein